MVQFYLLLTPELPVILRSLRQIRERQEAQERAYMAHTRFRYERGELIWQEWEWVYRGEEPDEAEAVKREESLEKEDGESKETRLWMKSLAMALMTAATAALWGFVRRNYGLVGRAWNMIKRQRERV